MLSPIEKVLFVLAVAASLYFTYRGVRRIIAHIGSGHGRPDWSLIWKRIGDLILKVGLFQPVFRLRLGPSILHGLIGWGFLTFLLINLADLIYAFTDFKLLESLGAVGNFYRLLADVAGVAIILGIIGMAIRRFILRPKNLSTRESTTCSTRRLVPASGATRRSWQPLSSPTTRRRLLGESFYVAATGSR